MGSKNNPGSYDCYANAEPDEPMFVLLGRDRHAPTLARLWAILRAKDDEDIGKVGEALDCADKMDKWREKIGKSDGTCQTEFEPLFMAATEGLAEHITDFNHSCQCMECLSYGE